MFSEETPAPTAEMFQLKWFLTCGLAFIGGSRCLKVTHQDGREFLENILVYYGENKSVSTNNLEDLLLLLSARRSDLINTNNPLEDQEVWK